MIAEALTEAAGSIPGEKLACAVAKWATTSEKARVGFSTAMSAGEASGNWWPLGTITAPAVVARKSGRYFSLPRKLMSLGVAAARAAMPEKTKEGSPRMMVPSMRRASS